VTDEAHLRQLRDLTPIDIWQGVRARRIVGERCMFAVIELDANTAVPEHRHPHEQLGIVLRGSGEFRVGEETRRVGPGDTWRIPSDVPHQFTVGPDGAVVIDVFAPPREDWAALSPAESRPIRWPAMQGDAA